MNRFIVFCDIGGVLLSNGWDSVTRERVYGHFNLDKQEIEQRHKENYPLHEQGKSSLEEYLNKTVFFKPRDFSLSTFISFIQQQSQPHPFLQKLIAFKQLQPFLCCALSNEGAELAHYRWNRFSLGDLFDFCIISAFVHLRKPDPRIYQLAFELTGNLDRHQYLYIEDRLPLVEAARKTGLRTLHHVDEKETLELLLQFLLQKK